MIDSENTETNKNSVENESEQDNIDNEVNTDSSEDITSIIPTEQQEDDEEETFHYEPKLTEKQQKVLQIILGLFCGFLVWFCLGMGTIDRENSLLRWLFLIVFVGIMIGKNQIEKRTGIMMRTFMKFFLVGLIVFLGVFLIYGGTQGMFTQPFIKE